jgi:hypothetical protein
MKRRITSFAVLTTVAAMLTWGCSDSNLVEAEQEATPISLSMHQQDPTVAGRTIQNINVAGILEDGGAPASFVGQIVNLTFYRVGDELFASGRLVGQFTYNPTELINQIFQGVNLGNILDALGLSPGDVACQILLLELGPIFLDVLGLIVEVPDPIVVEIRAEPGPGNLLGNLLCGLVGILDP